MMLDADIEVIKQLDETIARLETHVLKHAKVHDPARLHLLQTITGVGKVLSLVMLYEIRDVNRFENIGQFVSYARLGQAPTGDLQNVCCTNPPGGGSPACDRA